jgi:hypothetical protein
VFAWAAATNASMALGMPQVYLTTPRLPRRPYRMFIEGWFSTHIQPMVRPSRQGRPSSRRSLPPKCWRWVGVTGRADLLAAIALLGVGSASAR